MRQMPASTPEGAWLRAADQLWNAQTMQPCLAEEAAFCLQVVFYLVDLLQDRHPEVSKAADRALDVIMDTNEQWAVKLRALKFEAHNQDWLEATERMDAEVQAWRHCSCHSCPAAVAEMAKA